MYDAWTKQHKDRFSNSAVEAALWLVSLDDYLYKIDSNHRSKRDTDDRGRIVLGLYAVRNAGIHQLVEVHEEKPGLVFPTTFPLRFAHAAWRQLEYGELERTFEEARIAYITEVAGVPVAYTLESAQAFLEGCVRDHIPEDLWLDCDSNAQRSE